MLPYLDDDNKEVSMSEPEQPPAEVTSRPVASTASDAASSERARKAWRRRAFWRAVLIGLAFLAGFILLGIAAIQVWDYSNSVGFCTNVCHDVHPEETAAFDDSYHAEIKCTECHMGRLGTLRSIVLKAGHFRHLPEVIFKKYERPLRSATMRPASESCEKCHYPPAFHGDRVRQVKNFGKDEQSTGEDTYLILKTGGGQRDKGLGYGIHWHIENPVQYIATDEGKQEVRWVGTTLPNGRTVEYSDVTNPLTADQVAGAEKRTMDCVDCHNRVGHPFPSPEDLVDEALADGRLSRDLPYIRREMVKLLSAEYASQEEALAAVGQEKAQYSAAFPEAAAKYPAEMDQAQALARELIVRLVFEQPGVTWADFRDNAKHNASAGCFRCHDGKHLSADGESIRLHCNICHNVPETIASGDRAPQVPLSYIQEPDSHLATNFVADHRFQASEACAECHGEIQFGNDNSSFCANSSCHGRAWPSVNLNAAFPHPIALEGKHAQALCSDCHKGEVKPEYKCSNCHEPPQATHFGEDCERCHTPAGFDQATLANFQHPVPLEGAHASLDCTACHSGGQKLVYDCAACHKPPSEPHFGTDCKQCHNTTTFADATIAPDQHQPPLVGAHARAQCSLCHPSGQANPEYVCGNCHKAPANHFAQPCDTCHTPEGWAQSASSLTRAAPKVPHPTGDAMAECLSCHGEGKIKPAPANHKDFSKEQCTLCHKAED
jgi:hypothetical protein